MPMIMVTGISCRLTGVSGTMLNASHSLSYTHTHPCRQRCSWLQVATTQFDKWGNWAFATGDVICPGSPDSKWSCRALHIYKWVVYSRSFQFKKKGPLPPVPQLFRFLWRQPVLPASWILKSNSVSVKASVLSNCWLCSIREEDEASSPKTKVLLLLLTRPGAGGGEENAFTMFYPECHVSK